MTPKRRYQRDLDQGLIVADAAQQKAVELLDRLYQELIPLQEFRGKGFLGRLGLQFPGSRATVPQGVYLWGGVGRGKTYLMDVFHDSLPFSEKLRTHFHRFMQDIHRELRGQRGQKDPLARVAADIADQVKVICFDEFFVADIGDAMILSALLETLLDRGVVLVATSNIEPAKLYENGLQRARFLPAIKMLQNSLRVHCLEGVTDYRLRNLNRTRLFHAPLDSDSDARLRESFASLSPDFEEAEQDTDIEILGRRIRSRYVSDDVVWFDFDQLCEGPRSVYDYIEIARLYHAVLLGNIPRMGADRDDQVRRFINLVDELYDRGVKLVMTAAVPMAELYDGTVLSAEFQRTLSRLTEMQSHEYLARPHRP